MLQEATTKKDIHKKHRLFSHCLVWMGWLPAILLPAWGRCLHNEKGRITKVTEKPRGTLAAANSARLVTWCDQLFTPFWVRVFVDILQQIHVFFNPQGVSYGKQLLMKTSEVLDGPRSCKTDPLLEPLPLSPVRRVGHRKPPCND